MPTFEDIAKELASKFRTDSKLRSVALEVAAKFHTPGSWLREYNMGYNGYLYHGGNIDFRDEDYFRFNGPYRYGWLEAEKGIKRVLFYTGNVAIREM